MSAVTPVRYTQWVDASTSSWLGSGAPPTLRYPDEVPSSLALVLPATPEPMVRPETVAPQSRCILRRNSVKNFCKVEYLIEPNVLHWQEGSCCAHWNEPFCISQWSEYNAAQGWVGSRCPFKLRPKLGERGSFCSLLAALLYVSE